MVFFAMFFQPRDPSLQCPVELDNLPDLGRKVVDGGPRHVLLVGKELEILQRAVPVVAILPPEAMSRGNRSMRRFPDAPVDERPDFLIAVASKTIGNLHPQIPIGVGPHGADREIIEGSISLLELRFRHAPRGPTGPA
jgi:hypothetical protein